MTDLKRAYQIISTSGEFVGEFRDTDDPSKLYSQWWKVNGRPYVVSFVNSERYGAMVDMIVSTVGHQTLVMTGKYAPVTPGGLR